MFSLNKSTKSTSKAMFKLLSALSIYGGAASLAHACPAEPQIGGVCFTAANFCPEYLYIPADGRLVQISQAQALFALVGTTYGGDGVKTFAVPDLRGRSPVAAGAGPDLPAAKLGQKATMESAPASGGITPKQVTASLALTACIAKGGDFPQR
jgi:hypothetical protein